VKIVRRRLSLNFVTVASVLSAIARRAVRHKPPQMWRIDKRVAINVAASSRANTLAAFSGLDTVK